MRPKMTDSKVPVPEIVQPPAKKIYFTFANPLAITLVICFVIAVVTSVVIVAVVVVGRKDQEKETWLTIKTEDGLSINQRLTVSDAEEELYVPGQYHAVFDFRRSLLVIDDIKDEVGACMVLTFNGTHIPDPQKLLEMMGSNQLEEQGPSFERDRLELSLTKSKIHKAVLSEKARAMCEDKEAYWAIPSCPSESGRGKRAIDIDCELTFNCCPFSIGIKCTIRFTFSSGTNK